MRRTLARASLLTAINLLVFALIGTAVLAFTHDATRDTIARSMEKEKLKLNDSDFSNKRRFCAPGARPPPVVAVTARLSFFSITSGSSARNFSALV